VVYISPPKGTWIKPQWSDIWSGLWVFQRNKNGNKKNGILYEIEYPVNKKPLNQLKPKFAFEFMLGLELLAPSFHESWSRGYGAMSTYLWTSRSLKAMSPVTTCLAMPSMQIHTWKLYKFIFEFLPDALLHRKQGRNQERAREAIAQGSSPTTKKFNLFFIHPYNCNHNWHIIIVKLT
jgi:hypothetical protein